MAGEGLALATGIFVRNPDRMAPMLTQLAAAWHRHPDWRLGQLIANAAGAVHCDPFYIEDDELLEGIKAFGGES